MSVLSANTSTTALRVRDLFRILSERIAQTLLRRALARLDDCLLAELGLTRNDLAPANFRRFWSGSKRER